MQPVQLPPLPDKPLVSVLIPNYNYANYIGDALESVLRQTYTNFEVIVCDDGSTDNSCEVVNNYIQKDSRIKLLRKQNGGQVSAWNVAYRESKGQIICFLDADDIWSNNKLQKAVEAFISAPTCGFVFHNVIQVDVDGKSLKSKPMFSKLASGWMAPFALENGGFIDNIPPTSALCFRREITELILPMNEDRNCDATLRNLASFVTCMKPLPQVLSKYRLHGGNIMAGSSISADFLERELARSELIHQEVKQFLRRFYGAEVTEKLTDIKHRLTYCHNRYLLGRLRGSPKLESREAHRRLVSHPQFGWSGPEGWLLKWGEYLPDSAFMMLFHQVYGSGRLKAVARLIRNKIIANQSVPN
jgi:glycosyltransferase involved in cell wall biosynthesis